MQGIRLKIDNKSRYLHYERRGIKLMQFIVDVELVKPVAYKGEVSLFTSIYDISSSWKWDAYKKKSALQNAFTKLRSEIRYVRFNRKHTDLDSSTKYNTLGHALIGGVHTIQNQFGHHFMNRDRILISTQKKPKTKGFHVGIELEFITSSDESEIEESLINAGLAPYVNLTEDGSITGDSEANECNGDCRDECECYYCGESHVCDDSTECNRRDRNEGNRAGVSWIWREDCTDCEEYETIEDCNCGGKDERGYSICNGEHVICQGHCAGHSCQSYDDHDGAECHCECNCSDENGLELRILAPISKVEDIVRRSCEVLAEHDAYVNKTCGLHVHLDMRHHKNKNRAFHNLVIMQPLLYAMNPATRYSNGYCTPTKALRMDRATKIYDGDGGRYQGINPEAFDRHSTIEVRIHSGSINATKIVNWVRLLHAIVKSQKMETAPNTMKKLREWTGISGELTVYVAERITKFAKEHAKRLTGNTPNIRRIPNKFRSINLVA